jgi:hypothetical protein
LMFYTFFIVVVLLCCPICVPSLLHPEVCSVRQILCTVKYI